MDIFSLQDSGHGLTVFHIISRWNSFEIPMKFSKFEKDHFSEKHRKNPSKFKYSNFHDLFHYNRWHQSINGSAIEILIKIKPKKASKLNSLDIFCEKVILPRFKEFHGLHDDLKIIWKRYNPWQLSCTEDISMTLFF